MDTSWRKEELHNWAQAVPWDTSNPDDVWPLHLPRPSGGGLRAAATSDVSPTFMRAWGERLQWPDRDMLAQAAHGVLSRAQLNGDSVFMFMHKGLQRNMAPAVELVKKEQQQTLEAKEEVRSAATPDPHVRCEKCTRSTQLQLESLRLALV